MNLVRCGDLINSPISITGNDNNEVIENNNFLILSFPTELLVKIFSYFKINELNPVVETCRLFRSIVLDHPQLYNFGEESIEQLNQTLTKSTEKVKNYTKRIEWLIKTKGFNPVARCNLAIQLASVNGHVEVAKLLLADERVDPSADNSRAIQLASVNGHLGVVKLLLADSRVDPSANNNWAILIASANGYVEVVKLLLTNTRVDPSTRNSRAIQAASRNGHVEVVKLLFADSRVDPFANNNWAIQLASQNGHAEVVQLLQEKLQQMENKNV